MRVPWDSSAPKNDGTDVPNVPSEEGAALGAELARMADLEEERQREQFPHMLPRCNDCAFRKGTLPNRCLPTTMDALKCVVEGLPFYCHKGVKDGEQPTRLCSGFGVLAAGGASYATKMDALAIARRRARNKRKAARRRAA